MKNSNEPMAALGPEEEEVMNIVYRDHPAAELEDILDRYSDREEWFLALIEGAYFKKHEGGFKTMEEYWKNENERAQKIADRFGFDYTPKGF